MRVLSIAGCVALLTAGRAEAGFGFLPSPALPTSCGSPALPTSCGSAGTTVGVTAFFDEPAPAAILTETLTGLAGISVVSFQRIEVVLGDDVKRAIRACPDDACIVRATRQIETDRILAGGIDVEGGRTLVRLRLIDSSTTTGRTLARVSREVGSGGLEEAVSLAVVELFPDEARRSLGTVEIVGAHPGSRVVVDGSKSAVVPLSATNPDAPAILKLAPGVHEIKVTAPGHFPRTERAQVLVGRRTRIVVDLEKNRSNGPLVLAGVAAAAAIAAGILGGVTAARADDWEQACAEGTCAPGFTQERYLSDRKKIDQGRVVTNSLYGVAGAAALGALIWFFVDPGSDVEEVAP